MTIEAYLYITAQICATYKHGRNINTSHQNVSRWESGKILPSINFCVKLADLYGVSLDELVGRDK